MKPFLQGKKSISGSMLRPFAVAKVTGGACAAAAADGTAPHASIELVKDGDCVVRMIIHCGCGERIDVECLY